MLREYNVETFTPEDVEKGLDRDLINLLLSHNKEMDEYYNDIHVTTDGYCTIIEWSKRPYNGEWGGHFEYVDEDQYVVKNYEFPDGHCELCFDDEDYKERLEACANPLPGNLNEEE